MKFNSIDPIIPIFPIFLHQTVVDNYLHIRDNLIDYCYQEKKKFPEGVKRSNKGNSWHSETHYMKSMNIVSTTLRSTIDTYFKTNVFQKKVSYNFINSWININSKGGANATHNHPGSMLSGVLWVKVPKDYEDRDGALEFDNPHAWKDWIYTNSLNDDLVRHYYKHHEHYRNPVEGLIVMFPSYLMHRVQENKSNEDRISISFNVNIT
jgi:uncharacterized protein (TIGR02466 family)